MAGCTSGEPAPDLVPPHPLYNTLVSALTGQEEQGRHVLGGFADGLATNGKHISIVAPAGHTIAMNDRSLLVDGKPPVTGQMFPRSAGGSAALRIDGIAAPGYMVSYGHPTLNDWRPYCDDPGEPAYAMQGEWTTEGMHDPGAMVTFACAKHGKSGACEDFGYVPETSGTIGPGALGWDLNQDCVEMATANYCADGQSHTREETPILIRDFVPNYAEPDYPTDPPPLVPSTYPPVPPPPDIYYVEAAWSPRQPVRCLSKLRWNDQPPGGPCTNGNLKDPRIDPTAHFCEDMHLDLGSHDLINASKTMDLALHRWGDGAGQTVTTVHGYVAALKTTPPAGYTKQLPASSNEGFLLRNLTGTLDLTDVISVYRLRNPGTGDEVVGPDGMLAGSGYLPASGHEPPLDSDFEGYLLKTSSAQTLPFFLYTNGTEYVTATSAPTGYTKVGGVQAPPLGHVIGAPP